MAFIAFMRSTAGRLLRVGLGAVLMVVGFAVITGPTGMMVAAVGLLPIVAGWANVCLFAPLFGLDVWGRPRRA